ncbi:hypothetical protein Ddc_24227 [Ditylenchus destructor]|nr:hypothetical protein Ddc_24227 [Ditylenchus destructor]
MTTSPKWGERDYGRSALLVGPMGLLIKRRSLNSDVKNRRRVGENVLHNLPEFKQYIGRVKRAGEGIKGTAQGTKVRIKVMTTGGQTYAQPTLSSLAKQKGNSSIPCPRVHGEGRQFLFPSNVPPSEHEKIIREVQQGACTTLGVWDVTLDTNRDQLTSKNIEYLEAKIKTMESFVEQLGADVNAGRDYILKMIQDQGGDIEKAQTAAEAEASKFTDKTQQGVNRFNALLKSLETSITENFRRQIEQVRQELRAKESELVVVRAEKVLLQNQVDKYSKDATAARISKRDMEATKNTLERMLAKKDKEAKDLEKKLDEAYKAHTAKMAVLDKETKEKQTEVAETFKKLAAAQSELNETNEKIKILSFGEEERKKRYEDAQEYWRKRENTDIKLLNEEKEKLNKQVSNSENRNSDIL